MGISVLVLGEVVMGLCTGSISGSLGFLAIRDLMNSISRSRDWAGVLLLLFTWSNISTRVFEGQQKYSPNRVKKSSTKAKKPCKTR